MSENGQDSIRVYIYTADNGYSWQGCDEETSDSLKKCIGNPAAIEAGGIRRGTVGGLNGTAIFRRGLRIGGDFAGRDSIYIALAFLPFAHVGNRVVDFAKLWNHPLLAQPRGRGESLQDLAINLGDEGLVSTADQNAAGGDEWWTEEKNFTVSFEPDVLLSRLGALFQSRSTELGSLTARIAENGKRLSSEVEYKPFAVVSLAVRARDEYANAKTTGAEEKMVATAFDNWKKTISKLDGFVNPENGEFRHFLGFCEFAKKERAAFLGSLGGEAEYKNIEDSIAHAESVVNALKGHLTGSEAGLLDGIKIILDDADTKILRLGGDTAALERRCGDCKSELSALCVNSSKIARWIQDLNESRFADPLPPDGASPELSAMARAIADARNSVLAANGAISELKANNAAYMGKLAEKDKMLCRNRDEITDLRGRFRRESERHGAEAGIREYSNEESYSSQGGNQFLYGILCGFAGLAVIIAVLFLFLLFFNGPAKDQVEKETASQTESEAADVPKSSSTNGAAKKSSNKESTSGATNRNVTAEAEDDSPDKAHHVGGGR